MLTEGAVKATDKRPMFVGLDAYEAAGGIIERDLFQADGGGYLKDVGRLERLVREKLDRSADEIRGQGWLWVEAAPRFSVRPRLRPARLQAEITPRSDEEQAERARLQAEYDALEAEHAESEDLPEEADQRWARSSAALMSSMPARRCSRQTRSPGPACSPASITRVS